MEHPGVYCKKCNKTIKGRRYKCIECDDFDLCQTCESDYHSGHIIIRFTHPITQTENVFLNRVTDQKPTRKPFVIQGLHDEEPCHGCGCRPIDGFLYKCCDCSFNVCRRCERYNNRKCVTGSNHLLFRFTDPLSMNSVNDEFWIDILHIRRNMRNQAVYAKPPPTMSVIHEGIKCNACHCDVIGRRHKCIDCRDYDLCSSCEPKNIHLGHLLVRVGDTQLRSKPKQIFDEAVRLRVSTNKQSYRARSAYCNSWNREVACGICEESIKGYHYECLECEVDLCLSCQIEGLHSNHLMVRFTQHMNRNPVNQKFYEAVKELMACPQSPAFNKTITDRNDVLISEDEAIRKFTASSQMPANHKLYDAIPEAEMPNGSLKSYSQTLYEATREFTASSPMSANQIHYESTTSPNMSTDSTMSANQELYEASHPVSVNQALDEAITEPKMSTGPPGFTDKIFSEFLTDLRTCSEVPLNQALNETITESKMSTGSPLFRDQILWTLSSWYGEITDPKTLTGPPGFTDKIFPESLTDLWTCSEVSLNEALNEAKTEPKMSTGSPVFTDQISSNLSSWYGAITEPKMSTGSPVFTDKIFSESFTDLRTCSEVSLSQALNEVITEPKMSTGSPVFTDQISSNLSSWYEALMAPKTLTVPPGFTDKIFSESLTDLRTCSEVSLNQALNEAKTEPKMSTCPPGFTDKIFSESLTDLRTCSKWSSRGSSNQALDKAITEHSMSTDLAELTNLTLAESTTDLTTDSTVSANHTISEETVSHKTCSCATSPNQTLYEAETDPEISSGQQLSRTSSRANLTGKKRGKAKSKKQFTSFVDIINNNDRIVQEPTMPKCVLCQEKPCGIILLNCGHLCICTDCIDNFKKMSRQCPVCKFPIRSTHRAYY